MYPILLCSIVSVAILLERLFVLRKSRIIANSELMMHLAEKHSWDELKETAKKGDDLFSRVVYMTLDYGGSYDAEIARLESIGVEDYEGIYTVTGEPEGYDIVAMDSDEYCGFVYAMIPENSAGNTKITYCAIVFCNYFLDLDVHEYIPDKYLLQGFDATDGNPYREEKIGST